MRSIADPLEEMATVPVASELRDGQVTVFPRKVKSFHIHANVEQHGGLSHRSLAVHLKMRL